MQRLICYLILSMLMILPLSGQAESLRAIQANSTNAEHSSMPDCAMHQSSNSNAQTATMHNHQAMNTMANADCCQDHGDHNCGQPGSGSACAQDGCQCEHASSHLTSYLTSIDNAVPGKITADEIVSPRVLSFSGYPTALLRPPIRFI